MESVMVSVPVVHGNEVLITETYGPGSCLLKIGPTGHEVLWQDDVRKREKAFQGHMMTPILVDGFLYGCSGRNPPVDVRCVEWKTGKVTWKLGNQYRSSLLYVDGHFVSLDENGRLQLLKVDPKAYTKVAEWHLGAQDSLGENKNLKYPCWAAPILSHGLLYLRGKDRVVCLELISDR